MVQQSAAWWMRTCTRKNMGMKEDSQDDEVRSKRPRQQAKRAKASKPGPSPQSPPQKGFTMLPTCEISVSDEEKDYLEQNVRATYAKAKFARIRLFIQGQTVQMEKLIMVRDIWLQQGRDSRVNTCRRMIWLRSGSGRRKRGGGDRKSLLPNRLAAAWA